MRKDKAEKFSDELAEIEELKQRIRENQNTVFLLSNILHKHEIAEIESDIEADSGRIYDLEKRYKERRR